MDEDNEEPDYAVVEGPVGLVLQDILLGQVLLDEFQQVTEQFEVEVPVLVLFQEGRQEVLVADELDPGEGEVGVEQGVDFVEFFGEDEVESGYFFVGEVVLLAGGVADKVEE